MVPEVLQPMFYLSPSLTSFSEIGLGLLLVFSLRTALVAGSATLWTRLSSWARRRRVYQKELAPGQLASELKSTVVVVLFDALVAATVLSSGFVHFHAQPTALHVLGTYATLFVWFELWFYVAHRLLHTRPLFFLHRQHHVARVTDPFASMSFSLVERAVLQLGILGFAALVSHLVPIARAGPTRRGRIQLPPVSGTTPSLLKDWMKLAERAAKTRSQASARLAPAPAATPFTAAITGSSRLRSASTRGL